MISYFSVRLNPFQSQVFNCLSNQLKENDSFDSTEGKIQNYRSLSIDELIIAAKDDPLAKEEYLFRLSQYIYNVSFLWKKKGNVDCLNDLIETGFNTAQNALDAFDKSKGKASHLLTAAIKRSIKIKLIKVFQAKEKKDTFLKSFHQMQNYNRYNRCFPLEQHHYLQSDIISFSKHLSLSSREMLFLYIKGTPIPDIAKMTNHSYATTFMRINKIIKALNYYLHTGKLHCYIK